MDATLSGSTNAFYLVLLMTEAASAYEINFLERSLVL